MEMDFANAFKEMSLCEDVFPLGTEKDKEELKTFIDSDELGLNTIIDGEAETVDDIKDSYVGQVVLRCPVCQSMVYRAKENIVVDEDSDLVNIGDECPYCLTTDGYEIVGEIKEYCPECDGKEKEEVKVKTVSVDETDLDESKKGIVTKKAKRVVEEKETVDFTKKTRQGYDVVRLYKDGDRTHAIVKRVVFGKPDYVVALGYNTSDGTWAQGRYSWDNIADARKALFDEKGFLSAIVESTCKRPDGRTKGVKTEAKSTKRDIIDAEADNKKELARKYIARKVDDADADRDYRLKKGVTRAFESIERIEDIRGQTLDFGNEYFVLDYRDGKLIAGYATNIGVIPEYTVKYDRDESIDSNLEKLYDLIVADIGFVEESKKPQKLHQIKNTTNKRITESVESANADTIARWADRTIKWLVKSDMGLGLYKLDDRLAIAVGWADGYDSEDKSVIHSASEPNYAINMGIVVWTSDDLATDLDWMNQPYDENTMEVWDTMSVISPEYDVGSLREDIEWLLKEAKEMNKYDITEKGAIIGKKIEESKKPMKRKAVEKPKTRPTKKVTESVEEVEVKTETDKIEVRPTDDGVEVKTEKREETIEPVSDETKVEILGKDEDDEFTDIDIDEFDEASFDEVEEESLKRFYENVDSYKTTSGRIKGNKLIVEGVIKFKSGKTKPTKFVFESHSATKNDGKLKFYGLNEQYAKAKKSIAINGRIDGKSLVVESLTHNFNTNGQRIYKTIKRNIKK